MRINVGGLGDTLNHKVNLDEALEMVRKAWKASKEQ